MTALGVTDFRLLGGAGRYSDSGMRGLPDNDDPGCFWQADVDQAAGLLAEVILEVRPQVLVTYDDDGGYGHPDHIQAHRVAMRAVELAAEGGWDVPKVYWNRVPRSVAEEAFARLERDLPDLPFDKSASVRDVPGVVDDQRVTTAVDGTAYARREGRRDARPRHPDHRRRPAVLRTVQRAGAAAVHHRVLRAGARRADRRPGGRPVRRPRRGEAS